MQDTEYIERYETSSKGLIILVLVCVSVLAFVELEDIYTNPPSIHWSTQGPPCFPPPIITTASPLPTATMGVPYTVKMQAAGETYPLHWYISAGTLPAGLTLSTRTGVISGIPKNSGVYFSQITAATGEPCNDTSTEVVYQKVK